MLPPEVSGLELPSQEALASLQSKEIRPLSKIIISRKYMGNWYDTEVDNVLGYDIEESRAFGASSLTLNCSNPNGIYSYANSSSKMNRLFAHESEAQEVDFSSGYSSNISVGNDGELMLNNVEEIGEWTSEPMFGGIDFHSWRRLGWNIDPAKITRARNYYGSVNVFVRFGHSPDENDDSWSMWSKIRTVTGETSDFNSQEYISSDSPYSQVRVVLYPAFESASPKVYSLELLKFSTDGKVVDGMPLYYYGNEVRVMEYIMNEDGSFMEQFIAFNGIIDNVIPRESIGDVTLICQALDRMKITNTGQIEKPGREDEEAGIFEAKKSGETKEGFSLVVTDMELEPILSPGQDDDNDGVIDIVVHEDEEGSVFRVPLEYRMNGPIKGYTRFPKSEEEGDYKWQPWAERPEPRIYVERSNSTFELVESGYQIDYERGIVYFNATQMIHPRGQSERIAKVKASFSWYDLETNLFEDVVGEIIAMSMCKYGYAMPIQEKFEEEGYDIWTSETPGAPRIVIEHSNPRTVVPPTGYMLDDNKSFLDALSDMLRYVSPDYMIRATTNGDFVGEYRPQQETPHYELTLVEDIEAPISDANIFTKCIARGINPSMMNIAPTMNMTPNRPQLVNGNYKDNVLLIWGTQTGSNMGPGPPPPRYEFVRFSLKEPMRIGGMSFLIGQANGPHGWMLGGSGPVNLSNVGFVVEGSTDEVLWYDIVTRELSGSTGEWIHVDKSDFHQDIINTKFNYLRILITSTHEASYGMNGTSKPIHWFWAMREVMFFEDEEIRKEVSVFDLTNDGKYNIPYHIAEDMYGRIGDKQYVLPVDATLKTEDMVRARALDYLYETSRNLYTSNVTLIYAPHVQVGHTVSLNNPKLVATQKGQSMGTRVYYIDSITRSMSGGVPSVSVSLVSWI